MRRAGVWLFAILVVAAVLRCGVANRTLWFDEACTYWEARHDPHIEELISFSPFPSLIISPLVGHWDDPWMLRLPFVAMGVGSIVLFFAAARRLTDRWTALVTTGLIAVSPYHVLYSTEIRMYPIVLLGSAATFLFFVRILERSSWADWLGYVLGGAVATWAHPFVFLLLAAHGLYLLHRREFLARWIASQAVVLAAAAPALWYGVFVHGTGGNVLGWIHGRPLVALPATLYGFVLGNVFVPELWWWALSAVACVLFGALWLRGVVSPGDGRFLVVCSAVVPLAIIILVSARVDLYSEQSIRYLAFAQPFFLLLAAMGARSLRDRLVRGGAVALSFCVLVVGLSPLYLLWDREGMGAVGVVADFVDAEIGPRDRIVASFLVAYPLAYCLRHGPYDRITIAHCEDPIRYDDPPPRVWRVCLENRSMRQRLRHSGEHAMPRPVAPDGFTAVDHRIYPGRKPVSVTVFERHD